MFNSTAFTLLQNTLSDARGLNLQYFSAIDSDFIPIDCGIRSRMFQAELLYEKLRDMIRELPFGEILSLRDSMMLNYVIFRGQLPSSDFYTLGPFRSLPFEDQDYQKLRLHYRLSSAQGEELQALLITIPCNIMRTEALAAARNILLQFYDISDPIVREQTIEPDTPEDVPLAPQEDINARAKEVENTYAHESELLRYIVEGNYQKALREAEFFMHSNMDQRISNMKLSHRSLLYSSNTLFRKAAQSAGIHPIYLDDISKKFAQRLAICVSHQQLNDTYLDMLKEYCALCRNYATGQYSKNVQQIIDYILLNLSSDLTLDVIAEAVNFSPSYISRKFKEEVGLAPMAYITEQRIRLALRLLKETDMSVRDISSYVGIPDWNYFTKLFKKIIGTTPSEYKKRYKTSN